MTIYSGILSRLLQTISSEEKHRRLFAHEELELINLFVNMDDCSRFLYVRLFLRQENRWIRQQSLANYAEVQNIPKAIENLHKNNFILTQNDMNSVDIADMLELLQLDELKTLSKRFKVTKMSSKLTKSQHIQALISHSKRQKCILFGTKMSDLIISEAKRLLGPVVRVSDDFKVLIYRCKVACLCPRHWDDVSLTNDILVQINKRNYPKYLIDSDKHVFRHRYHLLAYENALKVENELIALLQLKDYSTAFRLFESLFTNWQPFILQAISDSLCDPIPIILYESAHVYVRILSQCSTVLARLHEFELEYQLITSLLSQPLFGCHSRGKWWCRLILILHRYHSKIQCIIQHGSDIERYEYLLEQCRQALGDSNVTGASRHKIKSYMKKFSSKVQNNNHDDIGNLAEEEDILSHLNIPKKRFKGYRVVSKGRKGGKSKWVTLEDDSVSVEQFAILKYQEEGWNGLHVENSVFSTLFGLLFWDILFQYHDGSFIHPFQSAPLDLDCSDFYVKRQNSIEQRLKELEKTPQSAVSILVERFDSESPKRTLCVGVNWDLELELLVTVINSLGPDKLSNIMRYYVMEHRNARSGLPDLILWKNGGEELKLVEIKGPGDSLQDNQKVWLSKLVDIGVDVEICLVQDDDNRIK